VTPFQVNMAPKRSPPMRDTSANVTAAPQREVKLPPFEEERPTAWFKSAEVMLNLAGVKDQEMWFYYTQWALNNQQKKLVDDVICMDPTPPDAYQLLKGRLLGLYDKGERERFARFRQLPDLGGPVSCSRKCGPCTPRGRKAAKPSAMSFFSSCLLPSRHCWEKTTSHQPPSWQPGRTPWRPQPPATREQSTLLRRRRKWQWCSRGAASVGRRGSGRPGSGGTAMAAAPPRAAPSHGSSWACAMPTTGTAATPSRRTAAQAAPGRETRTPGAAQRRRRRDAGPCGVPANGKALPCGHWGYLQPSAAQVCKEPSRAAKADRPQRLPIK
jgi:hypothetical protein